MGEPSGEVVAPPQPIETKKVDSNLGLSVNGSQLIALSLVNHLEEYELGTSTKGGKAQELKDYLKYGGARKELSKIKKLILEGNTNDAKNLLQQEFAHRKHEYPTTGDDIKEAVEALSTHISIQEATKKQRGNDESFREFIRSLPGKPLNNLPNNEGGRIFLTQLGLTAYVNPESNTLHLSPEHFIKGTADLPADQQHPFYIEEREVLGEPNSDNTISKLEIFAELAKRYPKVFTHITHYNFLPKILNSGFIGRPYQRDYKRVIASERGGVFVETLTFKDAPEYIRAIQQLKLDNRITVPDDLPRNDNTRNYPLHELHYYGPADKNPVAIFSDQFSQKHTLSGWLADDVADIKDKCLIGILVTPNYKRHLLHWISNWSDEKRQEVFGARKPEDVLISSVKDLVPLEK